MKKKKILYGQFSLIPETNIDGWCYGAITEFEDPRGCTDGDGFVQAPDGSRAGLVFDYKKNSRIKVRVIDTQNYGWGLYQVYFPKPIRTVSDLRDCIADVLPALQKRYKQMQKT